MLEGRASDVKKGLWHRSILTMSGLIAAAGGILLIGVSGQSEYPLACLVALVLGFAFLRVAWIFLKRAVTGEVEVS